jgi:hypothetical protein
VNAFVDFLRSASVPAKLQNCVDRWCQASIVPQIHVHPIALGLAVHSFTHPLSELYGFCENSEGTAVGLAARNGDLFEINPVPGLAGANSTSAFVARGKESFGLFGKASDCPESESNESLISAEQEEH